VIAGWGAARDGGGESWVSVMKGAMNWMHVVVLGTIGGLECEFDMMMMMAMRAAGCG
jgi:hypothetical protein